MRKRVHHSLAQNGRRGSRPQRVTGRMWADIFALALVGMEIERSALERCARPRVNEKSVLEALGAPCHKAIRRQEFGPEMSGAEMLAWLQASSSGQRH